MAFMNAGSFEGAQRRVRVWLGLALLAGLAGWSGCSTPSAARFAARQATDRYPVIAVLPMDVEVAELSAGGLTEKRDDWTVQVVANLNAAMPKVRPYRVAQAPAPDAGQAAYTEELDDLKAVYRAITLNQILHTYLPGMPRTGATHGALQYEVGPITSLLAAHEADAALVLFVRDDYATAGRKGLVALGVLAGIPVRGGVTVASAALVAPDGRVLWMNVHGSQLGDLRDREGAEDLARELLAAAPQPDAPKR